MENTTITNVLTDLESYEQKLINSLFKVLNADNNNMYLRDFVAVSSVNRAISILDGYITLAKTNNYLAAVSLLRLQIDNSLRFFATFLAKDSENVITAFIEGESIRKFKSASGSQLTDSYLVEELDKQYPNLKKAYNKFSGFIHLSNEHFYSALAKGENNNVQLRVGKNCDRFTDVNKIEISETLIYFTKILIHLIEGWADLKNKPKA